MSGPYEECTKCPLNEFEYVPSSGPEQADLVIVGEAPGAQEVLEGKPFAARLEGRFNAGYILWESLRQVDVEREKVFVTNVCNCRPPGNRQPTPKEIDCCRPRLEREIAGRNPKLILMLGNTALHTLARTRMGISEGRKHDWTVLGVLGLATYHPAAIIRQGDLFTDFASDLEDAVDRLNGKGRSRSNDTLKWTTINTLAQLKNLGNLMDSTIAVDIETSGFDPRNDFILCVTMSWGDYSAVVDGELLTDPQALAVLDSLLKERKQIYHNAKFDVPFLREAGITQARIDEDTMLLSYTLDERKGIHGLKELSRTYLGATDYESELKTYLPNKQTSYAEIPKEVLFKYAARDSHYTIKMFEILRPKVKEGLDNVYANILLPGARSLMRVESKGLLVDTAYMEQLEQRYTQEMEVLEEQLRDWGGPVFNPRSPMQVEDLLQKLALVPDGHKGANKAVLESLDHTFPKLLLKYRKVAKKQSVYIEGMKKVLHRDGRVRPSYLLHGTETGRLSTTKPAIHTIPREPEVRNLFIAPPGYKLIEADYNQHEFRIMAWYSQDERLTGIFKAGRKIHSEIAIDLYGKNYDHEDYMRAKMISFGILYGRGAPSLAMQLGTTVWEAQEYIARFFEMMPKVRIFLDEVHKQAIQTGELVTVFGRKRRFGLVTHENMHEVITQSNNYHCQSTASDLTMLSMCELDTTLPADKCRIVAFIHDALLFECKEEFAQEAAEVIAYTMAKVPERHLGDRVPFLSEPNIGNRWGELKG
jgi:uracil-DNA glycosylase family 4